MRCFRRMLRQSLHRCSLEENKSNLSSDLLESTAILPSTGWIVSIDSMFGWIVVEFSVVQMFDCLKVWLDNCTAWLLGPRGKQISCQSCLIFPFRNFLLFINLFVWFCVILDKI